MGVAAKSRRSPILPAPNGLVPRFQRPLLQSAIGVALAAIGILGCSSKGGGSGDSDASATGTGGKGGTTGMGGSNGSGGTGGAGNGGGNGGSGVGSGGAGATVQDWRDGSGGQPATPLGRLQEGALPPAGSGGSRRRLREAALAAGAARGTTGGTGGTVSRRAEPWPSLQRPARAQLLAAGWKFNRQDVLAGAQATSFNDSSWRILDLPHDWSHRAGLQLQQSRRAQRRLPRRRRRLVPQVLHGRPGPSSGQRILIELDGVYMNSEVWINGTSLGTRARTATPRFEYDLTPRT